MCICLCDSLDPTPAPFTSGTGGNGSEITNLTNDLN